MPTSRRQFLKFAAAPALLAGLNRRTAARQFRFRPFEDLLTEFIGENKIPGAALAVSRNRRVVYSQGFGLANLEKKTPVEADSLFRIASVSKPITAVAILHLVDAGLVRLDDPVLKYTSWNPHLEPGQKADPRWHKITVRHCLHHTGGWDRDKSGDPIGIPHEIARALGTKPPVSPQEIIRYMMGRPLDFDPGERFAYSNLGYLLLGRVIETAAGQGYEPYVKKHILGPLGITRMQLGRALPRFRARGEVSYYDSHRATGRCLYAPQTGETVPFPDGAANFEGYEAHGAWIASAIDLVKFASAFDIPAICPLLSQSAIATMWERPPGRVSKTPKGFPRAVYYGCGWNVRPVQKYRNTWHDGLISGTSALLVRRHDRLNWAVLFNTDRNPEGKVLSGLIDPLLHKAADQVF